MKRGFLKNRSLVTRREEKSSSTEQEPLPSLVKFATTSTGSMTYAPVKNREIPEGYQVKHSIGAQEGDGRRLDHPDDQMLFTTFPEQYLNTVRSEHPDGFTECLCDGETKRRVYGQPGFPRPLAQPRFKMYEIRASANKGLGMFALRSIKMADLVFSERPLMMTPATIGAGVQMHFPDHFTEEQKRQAFLHEWEKVMKLPFDRMFQEDRDEFMKLHNCHLHDGSGPISGIIRTNGLQVGAGLTYKVSGREIQYPYNGYSAVCKDISRINHSCRPNIYRNFDLPSFSYRVRATRDIKKGEELCISYCPSLSKASERAEHLAPYGISQCDCEACADSANSDARREQINSVDYRRIIDDIYALNRGQVDRATAELQEKDVLERLRLIEMEGLEEDVNYRLYLEKLKWIYETRGAAKESKLIREKIDKIRWFSQELDSALP